MNKLTKEFFKTPTEIFSQADLAVAIGGSDFSRHGLVKRAMANGEILNIRRGLYCLAPEYQKKPISVFALAQYIHGPSYISLETAFSYHGLIPEAVYTCTSVTYHNAKEFDTPLGLFSYQHVPQRTFYFDVERCVDKNGNIFFMATPAKALADYVYIHRLNWNGIEQAFVSLRIEPEDLSGVTALVLSDLMKNYNNERVKRFLAGWKETLE